jgi:hypothetical protein
VADRPIDRKGLLMGDLAVTLTVEQLGELVASRVRAELDRTPLVQPAEVMTLDEAAAFLKRHPKVVTKLTREASLPVHYISAREPRFRRSELLAWIDALPREPQATDEENAA